MKNIMHENWGNDAPLVWTEQEAGEILVRGIDRYRSLYYI
jgi:hypothetical protein